MPAAAAYRKFAEECRALAAKMTNPKDKQAVELMAQAWDKVADEQEADPVKYKK